MRLSEDFFYTLREDVSDEDSVSGKLLVKSGMIKKVSNGVYAKTPLGTKAFQNVEEIVRRNMNNAGADELKMPSQEEKMHLDQVCLDQQIDTIENMH